MITRSLTLTLVVALLSGPASAEEPTARVVPFHGYTQAIELPGCWIERGRIAADDALLLDSPLGWDGQRVLATLWFAAGDALSRERREALLDAARASAGDHALRERCGVTAPNDRVVVLRALAARVEPAMQMLADVWARWRVGAWQLPASTPRVWRT